MCVQCCRFVIRGEYEVEKENEVYGSKVMYVDRSERLVGNAVGDTKQNRFYTGTADGRLMQQKEFCFCEGGCASGNACKNDDVSGASERNYKVVVDPSNTPSGRPGHHTQYSFLLLDGDPSHAGKKQGGGLENTAAGGARCLGGAQGAEHEGGNWQCDEGEEEE